MCSDRGHTCIHSVLCIFSVRRGDVLAAWSGIRPLVFDPNKADTQSVARNHVIEVRDSKLITISGGTYIHIHTYIHTYTYIYIHTYTYIHIHIIIIPQCIYESMFRQVDYI